jgi:hypothetical protein
MFTKEKSGNMEMKENKKYLLTLMLTLIYIPPGSLQVWLHLLTFSK